MRPHTRTCRHGTAQEFQTKRFLPLRQSERSKTGELQSPERHSPSSASSCDRGALWRAALRSARERASSRMRSGGGVPTLSRALRLTALTTEKRAGRFFFMETLGAQVARPVSLPGCLSDVIASAEIVRGLRIQGRLPVHAGWRPAGVRIGCRHPDFRAGGDLRFRRETRDAGHPQFLGASAPFRICGGSSSL
jgi:hypothetical protein